MRGSTSTISIIADPPRHRRADAETNVDIVWRINRGHEIEFVDLLQNRGSLCVVFHVAVLLFAATGFAGMRVFGMRVFGPL